MKVSEYLFSEYKDLTIKYVAASQRLRDFTQIQRFESEGGAPFNFQQKPDTGTG